MLTSSSRPALRPVESIVVPDTRHGRVLVLRDSHGFTDEHAVIPPPLVPIVARFTGRHTCAEIAREASRELGEEVPVDLVIGLASELDQGLFLCSPAFQAAKTRIEADFAASPVRAASHAGGAYHADPTLLARFLDEQCLACAPAPEERTAQARRPAVGLVAPHIDPWRGATSYGHAYRALSAALPPEVDTFVLFGTSHAPMREPFALCRKAFDTPLGPLEVDVEGVDALAQAAEFDPYADQFNHKREHSLEFQAVFLRHVLGGRRARVIPVLAGLGRLQAFGSDPASDPPTRTFLRATRELVASRHGHAMVIAGADLAHVGPRFGDPAPYDARARTELEATDRRSLQHAVARDAGGFWRHVAADLDTRRVCGLAPIYALLETMTEGARGELLHYEQTVDDDDGSIVSHAAVAFYG